MLAYIAGKYNRHEEFYGLIKDLRKVGIIVNSRWIYGDHEISDKASTEEQFALNRKFALEDIEDIYNSDIFITFTQEPRTTLDRGGRHVELGYAYVLKKNIYIIGPRENAFHYLPKILRFPDLEEFIEYVKNNELNFS